MMKVISIISKVVFISQTVEQKKHNRPKLWHLRERQVLWLALKVVGKFLWKGLTCEYLINTDICQTVQDITRLFCDFNTSHSVHLFLEIPQLWLLWFFYSLDLTVYKSKFLLSN